MISSRRSKRLQKKTKRNIALTLLGIIFLFFLIAKFGIPAIANFAIFVSGFRTSNEVKTKDNAFIQPPVLNYLPTATNSSELDISGSADKESTVNLFLNDELVDSVSVNNDGTFKFTQTLIAGDNEIKTRAEIRDKKSDFSETTVISYINSNPTITIDTPADGDKFSNNQKSVIVTGKISAGASITVNGFWAIVDENNNYSYNLPLKNGDNEIKINATDLAGNETEKTIKVYYAD